MCLLIVSTGAALGGTGIRGEELTAEALTQLERFGWKVFHGLEFETTTDSTLTTR